MLDVLFIHANGSPIIYQDLYKSFSAREPPVWTAMLANSCRAQGHDVAILDCECEQLTTEESVKRILDAKPLIACFVVYGQQPSAGSQNMWGATETSHLLKLYVPTMKVMFIGPHVSALPKETLETEPSIDFVAINEGVYTLHQLLQANVYDEVELKTVKGLVWRDRGNNIVFNEPSKIVPKARLHVDLPGMAWDLLPNIKKYRTSPWHSWTNNTENAPFASLYTSLGCPYTCKFCMINIINRTKLGDNISSADSNVFRWWDPEFIIGEFDKIAKMGVRNVKIADELFVLNPRHFSKICDLIIERGYNFNIWAYSRIDTCKPEYLEKLKKAGVNWLGLGIENPSQTLRKEVHKDGFKEVKIDDLFTMMRNAGINIGANYIFGLPNDTIESMNYTLDFMMNNQTENMNIYCFTPGTNIYTPSGFKKIEEIKIGDEVFSKTGKVKVLDVFNRQIKENIYKIKPRLLPTIEVTHEHPFLVATLQRNYLRKPHVKEIKWKNPTEIKVFDKTQPNKEYDAFIIPKNNFISEKTFIDLSPYVIGTVGSGRPGGQLSERGRKYLHPIEITEDMAELFGWYVAEGSRASKKNNLLCFSLHKNEIEHQKEIQELLLKTFNFKSRIIKASENCVCIVFNSKVFYRAVHDIFGKTSQTKFVPLFIKNANNNIIKAFLKGYLNGDGTSHPNSLGQMSSVTASKILHYDLIQLFLKIGIVPSCGIEKPKEKVIKNRLAKSGYSFRISWMADQKHKKYHEDEQNFYLPVKKLETIEYEGLVYNITTQDETYCLPFITHNCAMAYPGSPLYLEAKKNGIKLPEKYSGYSQHSYDTTCLPTEHLTASEVLKFRDEAWMKYFTNPVYLNWMESKFGKKCRENIEGTTKIKLKRKLLGD